MEMTDKAKQDKQCTYNVNTEERSRIIIAVEKQ